MFFATSLTEDQAQLIAEAYYRSGKDLKGMAAALGVAKFEAALITHPLVKRQIAKLAQRMRRTYTLEEHLERLQEIRDQAMDDGNLRIALAAELSVGKAAGLYDKVAEETPEETPDAKELSTEEIRERLARLGGAGTRLLPDSESADVTVEDGEEF